MSFDTIPSKASLQPKPFSAHVSDEDLKSFQTLLKHSRIGPKTYENLTADVKDFNHWGISRQWVADAKQHWETKYDWRKTEDRINSYPNFTVPIEDSGFDFQIHFVALFSKKPDAVPLALLHGWPGSFLEFLGTLDVLREKYKPEDLPFHVIVPSLPGYGYSNGPPLDKNFDTEGIARVVDKLMVGLGFGDGGYVAQGGDVGSFVSRVLGVNSEACKAVHLNLAIGIQQPDDVPMDALSKEEQEGLVRYNDFGNLGNAYAREHGTRPSTIGLVLSSSPVALLAWVGEKFLQWSDESPPLDEILDSVTLYWFTDSFPRAIYPYRQFFGPKPTFFHPDAQWYIKKPMGYSWHPKELAPVPKAWVAKSGNLVWYRGHTEGGHFAAMERPKYFVKDVEDFVKEVWPTVK
ncbi:hypothetical protein LTS02_007981 [Friedmanniomyces endolithicus]|nr:hypothetical protein LTR94_015347 [Friedmanniomyces endolithicus]KAK0789824.1 hypothetical protein LTR59_009474 [Friedmanniomyces endolithicus]KAK0807899.1 hypothetical protein LTR38_004715 [Friedmanniomyces endolithicus]KAK0843886.1 hypothetical protein LTR03_008372 [Friedmanniomyces endolithicus]KAK0861232.1 hypothetical protein LTS02_007981 [Friedmanniomyces endolithicus]